MKILEANIDNYCLLKETLSSGNPIIIPTDTNYNFCCLPNDKEAIDKIFEYKIRPKNKPLSIFISKPENWTFYGVSKHTDLMEFLIKEFWPGALNIVVENKTNYDYALNGSNTISLGCVRNKVFREFVDYVGGVVAITSANISGTADDMLITESIAIQQMGDKVDYLLQSQTEITNTKSSTIVKINDNGTVSILREGDISKDKIRLTISKGGFTIED